MPKQRKPATMNFGELLATLRKAAGYTQVELAREMGISQRMVAYYESPEAHPPANLLPDLARVLGVTTDELLGLAPAKRLKKAGTSRLERRLQQIEKLPRVDAVVLGRAYASWGRADQARAVLQEIVWLSQLTTNGM